MPRELVQARCDEDITDALKHYAEDRGISKSEAVRRMVRQGLARNGYEITAADGIGTSDEDIEEIRNELGEIEQRQLEIANQHERQQQLLLSATLAVIGGIGWAVVTLATGASGPLWATAGLLAMATLGGINYLLGDADE